MRWLDQLRTQARAHERAQQGQRWQGALTWARAHSRPGCVPYYRDDGGWLRCEPCGSSYPAPADAWAATAWEIAAWVALAGWLLTCVAFLLGGA